ncbi:MAG: CHAT domain-containing tetratricopeptide repeat protein [Aureispira sp.]
MKLFFLSLFLLFTAFSTQAQQDPVLDTVAILEAQKALEEAEVLFSKEHLNYAKAAVELSGLYMQTLDKALILEWEDLALASLAKIYTEAGPNSPLYQAALKNLPYPIDQLFDSQLALEAAEKTRKSNPALYVEKLFWRSKVFIDDGDLEAYDLMTMGMQVLASLPTAEQNKLLAYAKRHLNTYRINIATSHAAVNIALANPVSDSLELAAILSQYGAAVLAQAKKFPKDDFYLDSAYLRLSEALVIYDKQLGTNHALYQKTYKILTPRMQRYYLVERPFFERLEAHETNNDDFIILLQRIAQLHYDEYVPTYEFYDLFRWARRDIKKHYGIDNLYYKRVASIENNWELSEVERKVAMQKDLIEVYRSEQGREGRLYLEALIELGNIYAHDGDDVPAETVFHQAFDQLALMDQRGVLPPEGDGTLLQYYWAQVISTWRVVLIQEHNLNVMQQLYGLQSGQYWEAYYQLLYEHYRQNILADKRGASYLKRGISNLPPEHLDIVLPWLDALFKLDPEYHIDPIIRTLPKVVPIPQLEELLVFSMDSVQRQYSPISTEMGKFLEVLADAYFYDTTKTENAAISLKRYQEVLEMYQKVGDEYAYTELLDRVTQNITQFSPWTEEQVSTFFEELIRLKEEQEKDYERYFLKYVERYANWLYESERLVASEQYFERIARYFERENPDYLVAENASKTNDWYLRTIDKLASIYRKTGRRYRARDYYKKLIRLAPVLSTSFEEGVWKVVHATNNIGDLFYREKQYEEALEIFDLTLENIVIFQEDFTIFDTYKEKKSAILYVDVLQNKGRIFFELEEIAQARLYFNKALHFVEDPRSPIKLKEVGSLLANLATLAVYDYEDEKAERYYNQALAVITDKEELSQIHLAFAEYYQVTERDDLASIHLLKALSTDLKRVQQNYTSLSEQERLLFLKPILKRFDTFFEFAIRYNNPDLLLEAFNSHLIIKGLSLETTNNLQSVCNVTENMLLRNKCLEMQNLRKELSSSTSLPLDIQNNLDARITDLEKEIGLSSKDLRTIYDKNNRNLDFVDIKRLLYNMETPDSLTMAIDFLLVPETNEAGIRQSVYYAAVVIPRHPYPHFVRLATQEELADVLAADVSPTSFNYITETSESRYLYSLVWEPLLPYINQAQHLHLCPTGILSRIAFGTLQTGNFQHKRIMNKWSIHYYGALRDLLHLKSDKGPTDNTSALLVGGVKFDLTEAELNGLLANNPVVTTTPPPSVAIKAGARGEDFVYLDGTLEEVLAIGNLFPSGSEVKLLSGVLATEENLTNFANEAPDILHIATHGYFFPTPTPNSQKTGAKKKKKGVEDNIAAASNPLLRSGLALAGINRVWKGGNTIEGLEDGIFTALEVSNLDLFNTKLVVLSACETGRGDIDNTEGILGLRRAFKIAGAQQLIISLWKVPDAQTAELMQLFYARYLTGNSAHAAFEYAQQEMSRRYKNPYYWAAFLLIE